MAFFDKFLKRRKTGEHAQTPKRDQQKTEVASLDASEKKANIRFGVAPAIRHAHVTEKSSAGGASGRYTFIVSKNANKPEIAHAIESKYGVRVHAVRVLSMPGKERRRGGQIGWKSGFKKAVVTLKEGNTIDVQ